MPSNVHELFKYTPFALYAIVGFVLYALTLVNMVLVPIVEEKELGIREFLRIASTYYELNLFTFYLLHVTIGALIFGGIVAAGCFFHLCGHFAVSVALVLVVLFVAALVQFTFLVSVLFNTIFYAKNGGFLLLLAPYALQFYKPVAFLLPFLSPGQLWQDAWTLIDESGARGVRFGWAQLFEVHSTSEVSFSMFELWELLLLQTLLFALAYTYLVQVFPGTYGTPRPFYFPLIDAARCLGLGVLSTKFDIEERAAATAAGDQPAGCQSGDVVVRVRGLTKAFGTRSEPQLAVNQVDMDIAANQITVLLGHNGAGKTTLMSIVSGIIPKTSGEIAVNGERDVNVYRKQIGYCPQHNVFLPYFTCMDHLEFFGRVSRTLQM